VEHAVSAAETSALLYRPFTADDIAAAHALSVEVKWPHRADDWRFVLDAGAGFIAQDGERVVGTALCWKYGDDGGSLGNRITVLHATPAGEPLYAKLGFRRIGAIHQHQSADFDVPEIDLPPGERMRAIEPGDTRAIADLASRASGLDRSALWPALLKVARGVVLERDGEMLGFSLIREFGRGHAIGPVVAVTADQQHARRARALIAHALASREGTFTRIDTPDESGLSDWLEGIGLERVDTVIKMARNGTPPHDASVAQFAIINQALC
jgi:hypothetical protein